jgi:hypothetical protein
MPVGNIKSQSIKLLHELLVVSRSIITLHEKSAFLPLKNFLLNFYFSFAVNITFQQPHKADKVVKNLLREFPHLGCRQRALALNVTEKNKADHIRSQFSLSHSHAYSIFNDDDVNCINKK